MFTAKLITFFFCVSLFKINWKLHCIDNNIKFLNLDEELIEKKDEEKNKQNLKIFLEEDILLRDNYHNLFFVFATIIIIAGIFFNFFINIICNLRIC